MDRTLSLFLVMVHRRCLWFGVQGCRLSGYVTTFNNSNNVQGKLQKFPNLRGAQDIVRGEIAGDVTSFGTAEREGSIGSDTFSIQTAAEVTSHVFRQLTTVKGTFHDNSPYKNTTVRLPAPPDNAGSYPSSIGGDGSCETFPAAGAESPSTGHVQLLSQPC